MPRLGFSGSSQVTISSAITASQNIAQIAGNPVLVGRTGQILMAIGDPTANQNMNVDSHGSAHVLLYDASGNVLASLANPVRVDPTGTTTQPVSLQPGGGTDITATATGGNASNAATLPGVAGKTTYITGFQVTASGATAGLDATVTVAGVISGTMNYTFTFPAGVLVAATPLIVNFARPVPASAVNTAIVVTLPAGGAGNTNASVSAQGLQL